MLLSCRRGSTELGYRCLRVVLRGHRSPRLRGRRIEPIAGREPGRTLPSRGRQEQSQLAASRGVRRPTALLPEIARAASSGSSGPLPPPPADIARCFLEICTLAGHGRPPAMKRDYPHDRPKSTSSGTSTIGPTTTIAIPHRVAGTSDAGDLRQPQRRRASRPCSRTATRRRWWRIHPMP